MIFINTLGFRYYVVATNTSELEKVLNYNEQRLLGLLSFRRSSKSETGLCTSGSKFIDPPRGFISYIVIISY